MPSSISRQNLFISVLLSLITIKFALGIVNNPPDSDQTYTTGSLNGITSLWNRFQRQSSVTRDFKNGIAQWNVWGSSSGFPSVHHSSDPFVNISHNPAHDNNLPTTSNDHVDHSPQIGAANGYIFPRPAKTMQLFKTFGLRLGKFGHLYGTGAFYSHHDYPYEA